MNKYFVNENWCIRFESSNHFTCKEGTAEITDLYIFKHPFGTELLEDGSGWVVEGFIGIDDKPCKRCTVNENYIFEFESDEEALLLFEIL